MCELSVYSSSFAGIGRAAMGFSQSSSSATPRGHATLQPPPAQSASQASCPNRRTTRPCEDHAAEQRNVQGRLGQSAYVRAAAQDTHLGPLQAKTGRPYDFPGPGLCCGSTPPLVGWCACRQLSRRRHCRGRYGHGAVRERARCGMSEGKSHSWARKPAGKRAFIDPALTRSRSACTMVFEPRMRAEICMNSVTGSSSCRPGECSGKAMAIKTMRAEKPKRLAQLSVVTLLNAGLEVARALL